jgi:hypothetical protein
MKAMITTLSYEPIKVDITSASDSMQQFATVGYRISFNIRTARFDIQGECELREYPLNDKEIEAKLITALEEDFLQASAEGITPIIK